MAKDHITLGSARYFNEISKKGVQLVQNSSMGTDAIRIERGSDGVARERRTENVKTGLGFGKNGQLTPVLTTIDGSKIVIETGPGTTGQLSQLIDENKKEPVYLSLRTDLERLPDLPEELTYNVERTATGALRSISIITKEKQKKDLENYKKFCEEHGLQW